jgi:hypothetical protein
MLNTLALPARNRHYKQALQALGAERLKLWPGPSLEKGVL